MKAQGKNVAHYFSTHAQSAPLVAIPTGLPEPRRGLFSSDGQHFFVQTEDGAWSSVVAVGEKMGHLHLDDCIDAADVVFAPNGHAVAMRTTQGTVFVRFLQTTLVQQKLQAVDLMGGEATDICFARGGTQLVVGLADGGVLAADVAEPAAEQGSRPKVIYQHDSACTHVGCSQDGLLIMTASHSGRVVLINANKQAGPHRAMTLHGDAVVAHAFSPCGAYLATADTSGRLLISHVVKEPNKPWSKTGLDSEHFITVVEVACPTGTVTALTFSPKSSMLCAVYQDIGLVVHRFTHDAANGPVDGAPQTFAHALRPWVLFSPCETYLLALGDKLSVIFHTDHIRQDAYALLPSATKALCPVPSTNLIALGLSLGEWWPTSCERLYALCRAADGDNDQGSAQG